MKQVSDNNELVSISQEPVTYIMVATHNRSAEMMRSWLKYLLTALGVEGPVEEHFDITVKIDPFWLQDMKDMRDTNPETKNMSEKDFNTMCKTGIAPDGCSMAFLDVRAKRKPNLPLVLGFLDTLHISSRDHLH